MEWGLCDYDRIEGEDEKENHQRRISIGKNGRKIGLWNLVYWNVWNPQDLEIFMMFFFFDQN